MDDCRNLHLLVPSILCAKSEEYHWKRGATCRFERCRAPRQLPSSSSCTLACQWQQMLPPWYSPWTKKRYTNSRVLTGHHLQEICWILPRLSLNFKDLLTSRMQYSWLPWHGLTWQNQLCSDVGGNCGQGHYFRTTRKMRKHLLALVTRGAVNFEVWWKLLRVLLNQMS